MLDLSRTEFLGSASVAVLLRLRRGALARGSGDRVSACATTTSSAPGPAPAPSTDTGMGGMSGMSGMAAGNGLTGESSGFTFTPVTAALPAATSASFRFRIQAADGTPVTAFEPDQTKLMHFYLVRNDLTGF